MLAIRTIKTRTSIRVLNYVRKLSLKFMDKEKLLIGVLFGILAQTLTFFQLQGPMKYEWFKNHYWLVVLMGIPVSMLFMYSVKSMISAYGGEMWPSRLIGFSIGAVVFTYFSWSLFGEPLTMKTIICLILSFSILGVQLFIK
jgi:multidrug transporter EmrE-like cation transporter